MQKKWFIKQRLIESINSFKIEKRETTNCPSQEWKSKDTICILKDIQKLSTTWFEKSWQCRKIHYIF